jgi:transcriptional regulator with XRE-family HTH domain
MRTDGLTHEEFLESPERRKLYEQERLFIEATELLTEVMEKKGITRAQLAQRLGKTKAYVTQVLRGNHNMTLRTLADLFSAVEHRISLRPTPYPEAEAAVSISDDLTPSKCYEFSPYGPIYVAGGRLAARLPGAVGAMPSTQAAYRNEAASMDVAA